MIIIQEEQLDLILYFLKMHHLRSVLDDVKVQEDIVRKYLKRGKNMYYGAEMISFVHKAVWTSDLTK